MATAKTGSFYLTETVTMENSLTAGSRVQGTIDLGAYVNVATGQAIAVESVDFIYQWNDGGVIKHNVSGMLAGDGSLSAQLSDLNPSTAFLRADDQSLIASGALQIDTTNSIATHSSDLFPDNFGPAALSEAFMVVNDSLYLVAGPDGTTTGTTAGDEFYVTARIKCRIVKLGQKDWVAIAIQSTASDN